MEGSICAAFLCRETSSFCSYYFEGHVRTVRSRVRRNDDEDNGPPIVPTLSVFNSRPRLSGASTKDYMSDRELDAAATHVLLNCEEVNPYIE